LLFKTWNDVPTRNTAGMRASRSMNCTCEPMFWIPMPIFIPRVPTS
jgi:hypothetical protein